MGRPLPQAARYTWGVTADEVNSEVGAKMVKRYRRFLTSFLPSDPTSIDHEYAAVYVNTKTREFGRKSDGSMVRRLIKKDVEDLTFDEMLHAIYLATVEVKGRKMFRETRSLPLGKSIFREHGAPFSFIDVMASTVKCVNNAAGYATDALLLFLAWKLERGSTPDSDFDEYAFVSDLFE